MPSTEHIRSQVAATVDHVLPQMGIAYLVADGTREWAVTRHTRGLGFDSLKVGQRVALTVVKDPKFEIVQACELLD